MDGESVVIDKSTMLKICKYGTYYNPATKHYTPSTNVMCDKCYKDKLNISIGYEDYDLCLSCIEEINKMKKNQKK